MPESYSDRGFAQYGRDIDANGGAKVSVYESSKAESSDVWLSIYGNAFLQGEPVSVAGIPYGVAEGHIEAELTVDQARKVYNALGEFLSENNTLVVEQVTCEDIEVGDTLVGYDCQPHVITRIEYCAVTTPEGKVVPSATYIDFEDIDTKVSLSGYAPTFRLSRKK